MTMPNRLQKSSIPYIYFVYMIPYFGRNCREYLIVNILKFCIRVRILICIFLNIFKKFGIIPKIDW